MLIASNVTSNSLPIPFNDTYFVRMPESDPESTQGLSTILQRFHRDGYVLVRGLLDPMMVRTLRSRYFASLPGTFLRADSDPVEGIYSGAVPNDLSAYGVSGHPAHDFVRDNGFNQLCDDRRLRTIASLLLGGGDVVALARRIVRHFWRDSGLASRAHRDRDYMSEGGDDVVTAWIPLGDCSAEMGSLVYLEGSSDLAADQLGRIRERMDRTDDTRPLTHDLKWASDVTGRRWRWTDFRAGDVAFHGPYIVHASLDSASDVMRLSADIRLQRENSVADGRWRRLWSADDGA